MNWKIIYPRIDKIIEYNYLALKFIPAKKADSPKVLSMSKLREAVEACEEYEGDVYDKAVCLLKALVQKHAFARGNRRTALIVTQYFLLENKQKFVVTDEPKQARVMQGVRENYYSHEEVKEWLKNGKIREFRR